MGGMVNEKQKHVYNALSVVEYTAARDFSPRIDPTVVPNDEVFTVLKELEAQALAELAFGQGWRAIESEHAVIGADFKNSLREWRAMVNEGLTLLSFKQWLVNTMLQREQEGKGQ